MMVKRSQEGCTETASNIQARMLRLYSEAGKQLMAGHVKEALSKYDQIIREGRSRDEYAISKLVYGAMRQRPKCQFRLLFGTAGPAPSDKA